jgi:membrane-bound serine protease (ClpP class)
MVDGLWLIILNPWVTILMLLAGMMLIISEVATIRTWGGGLLGVLCVGLVLLSYVYAGIASWLGVVLLLSGAGLFLVEARVLPGHGISALGGTAGVSLGTYWTLGGAASGLSFALSAALLVTALSVIAFLVYLPRSHAWRAMSSQVEVHVGTPGGVVRHIAESEAPADLKAELTQASEEEPPQQIVGHTPDSDS